MMAAMNTIPQSHLAPVHIPTIPIRMKLLQIIAQAFMVYAVLVITMMSPISAVCDTVNSLP